MEWQYSFTKIGTTFRQLEKVESSLQGIYQAAFIGPGWLRRMAPPGIALLGLPGWWGKRFDGHRGAVNLLYRNGQFEERLPMQLQNIKSYIDGKSGIGLLYSPSAPIPWPWVVDELRILDGETLIGMTIANLGPLRKLAFPFILNKISGIIEAS